MKEQTESPDWKAIGKAKYQQIVEPPWTEAELDQLRVAPGKIERMGTLPPNTLLIDFTDHEDLREWLTEAATREDRPLDRQVRWILKQWFSGKKGEA